MTSRLQTSGIAALSFTLSAAVLALALTPAAASAQTNVIDGIELTAPGDRMVTERRVSASDVDFTNAADMRKLNGRISRAITAVCDSVDQRINTVAESQCRRDARASSDRQVAALRSEAIALAALGRTAPTSRDIVLAGR